MSGVGGRWRGERLHQIALVAVHTAVQLLEFALTTAIEFAFTLMILTLLPECFIDAFVTRQQFLGRLDAKRRGWKLA